MSYLSDVGRRSRGQHGAKRPSPVDGFEGSAEPVTSGDRHRFGRSVWGEGASMRMLERREAGLCRRPRRHCNGA